MNKNKTELKKLREISAKYTKKPTYSDKLRLFPYVFLIIPVWNLLLSEQSSVFVIINIHIYAFYA